MEYFDEPTQAILEFFCRIRGYDSLLHSRFWWGGALRDDTKNGCVSDHE